MMPPVTKHAEKMANKPLTVSCLRNDDLVDCDLKTKWKEVLTILKEYLTFSSFSEVQPQKKIHCSIL